MGSERQAHTVTE